MDARDQGIRRATFTGLTIGIVYIVMFSAYGLGFWYGAKLTRDEPGNYSLGNVLIVSTCLYNCTLFNMYNFS